MENPLYDAFPTFLPYSIHLEEILLRDSRNHVLLTSRKRYFAERRAY